MAFSFGGAPAPAAGTPAPSTTGGFSFGGSAAPAATTTPGATATTTPAAVAAAGGFSFNSNNSKDNNATTAAPATTITGGTSGFSFSSSTTGNTNAPAPAAPAPGTTVTSNIFGGGGSASAQQQQQQQQQQQPVGTDIVVPEYQSTFPQISIFSRVSHMLSKLSSDESSDEGKLAGQQLIHMLQCNNSSGSNTNNNDTPFGDILCKPKPISLINQPDNNFRNKIQQKPSVLLQQDKEAPLKNEMLNEVYTISNELRISEIDALTLYASVASPSMRNLLEEHVDASFVDKALYEYYGNDFESTRSKGDSDHALKSKAVMPLTLGSDFIKSSKELYFYERSCGLKALLLLLQHRIQVSSLMSGEDYADNIFNSNDSNPLLVATDQLITSGLVGNLISFIMDCTKLSIDLEKEIHETEMKEKQGSHPLYSMTAGGGPAPMLGVTAAAATNNGNASSKKQQQNFATVLVKFLYKQRQMAATCLFYLTYNTQCTAEEVASLIDLIKDLTNGNESDKNSGLPILDPFEDVPKTYIEDAAAMMMQQQQQQGVAQSSFYGNVTMFTQSLPPLKIKDKLEWEKELVHNTWNKSYGKAQLQQCVSTLTMSVITSLDGKHVLMDRTTHGPNSFGIGNALLPPSVGEEIPATEQLGPIQKRLDPNIKSSKNWNRKDIWGLLASSYALLLRPVTAVASSPRMGSANSSFDDFGGVGISGRTRTSDASTRGPIDIKATWLACLEAPILMKSFTFARMSLISTFERQNADSNVAEGSTVCNDYEFFMSVLSEFISHYIDVLCASGQTPISREKWYKDEATNLENQRTQQQQQANFNSWSGVSRSSDTTKIPDDVDLLKRPDCMDDVMALAVAVCSAGPEYSNYFWSRKTVEETDEDTKDTASSSQGNEGNGESIRMVQRTQLVPSPALKGLERSMDSTLRPSYLSFLAALALADSPDDHPKSMNGAGVIHSMLSSDNDYKKEYTWFSFLCVIRWYVHQLDPAIYGTSTAESMRTDNVGASAVSGYDSTAYYYGTDDNHSFGTTGAGGDSSGQQQQQRTGTGSVTPPNGSKVKSLGDVNIMTLLSYLNVIASVASNSEEARSAIVNMKLPVSGEVGEDEVLTVLFTLAIAPVPPIVRGAVFVTISSLLRTDNPTQEERELAKRGWLLLEETQVLPTTILDQFVASCGTAASRLQPGIKFPPSSTAQVGSEATYASPWSPPETRYGIIYELEYVESQMGFYPSTEGLLHLLTSLIHVVGCPPDLGSSWRPRPGCSPYLEYVIHFVLPRAMGVHKNDEGLPFRTLGDKVRLASLALEVVLATISRYEVPTSIAENTKSPTNEDRFPSKPFGLSSIDNNIFVAPVDTEKEDFALDFKNLKCAPPTNNSVGNTTAPQHITVTGEMSFPRPKSPEFMVLVDILSSSGGDLYKAIACILAENFSSRGIGTFYGKPEYQATVVMSLFGETPPTFSSTKSSDSSTKKVVEKQSLLRPPLPAGWQTVYDFTKGGGHKGQSEGVTWKERSVTLSLRILAAAAARESQFSQALGSISAPLTLVPVVRFCKSSGALVSIEGSEVQISRLAEILSWTLPGERIVVLRAIVDYMGYMASSAHNDAEVASGALALIVHVVRHFPTQQTVRDLCGNNIEGNKHFSSSMARRLQISSKEVDSEDHAEIADLLLELILGFLRLSNSQETTVSDVMLGLPIDSSTRIEGNYCNFTNCFDVVLDLLSRKDFVLNDKSSGLATKCYEIIYRLTSTKNIMVQSIIRKVSHVAGKLRNVDFWQCNLLRFLAEERNQPSVLNAVASMRYGNEHILQSSAWFLKGLSNELRLLMGLQSGEVGPMIETHPNSCRDILKLLFGEPLFLAFRALQDLPLARNEHMAQTYLPPSDTVKASVVPLIGPKEAVEGYTIISLDIFQQNMRNNPNIEAAVAWAKQWNEGVLWDSAASHLADSVRCLVGSSFAYCKPLLLDNGIPLYGRSIAALLSLILSRFTGEIQHTGRPLDKPLYSSAVMNLAMTALNVTEEFATIMRKAPGSLAEVSLDLARVVASTSPDGQPQTTQQAELAAVLGTSLARTMQCACDIEDAGRIQSNGLDREAFVEATLYMLQISSHPVNGISRPNASLPDQGSAVVLIARSVVSTILRAHDDDAVSLEESFVFQALMGRRKGSTTTSVSSLVQLVPTLDDDVSSLLEQIALCRYGTEILQDAGLHEALLEAARKYSEEEALVGGNINATGGYPKANIRVPTFLLGHLSLLNTMLQSPSLEMKRRILLVNCFLQIIQIYSSVVGRIFSAYPTDGEVGLELMKSIHLSFSVIAETQSIAGHDAKSMNIGGDSVNVWDAIENQVLDLSCHISQFPFPTKILPSLPLSLKSIDDDIKTHRLVVAVTTESTRCWWDQLPDSEAVSLPDPPTGPSTSWPASSSFGFAASDNIGDWSDSKYEQSIQNAEILESCLLFLIERVNLDSFCVNLDAVSLGKGFCRCVDAARAIEGRLRTLEGTLSTSYLTNAMSNVDLTGGGTGLSKTLEKQYLSIVGPLLGSCAEKILLFAFLCIRNFFGDSVRNKQMHASDQYKRNITNLSKVMIAVIEHAEVEKMGIGCVGWKAGEEYKREIAKELSSSLRQEVGQMQKNTIARM